MDWLGIDDTFIAGFVCMLAVVCYGIVLWLFLEMRVRRWLRATTRPTREDTDFWRGVW